MLSWETIQRLATRTECQVEVPLLGETVTVKLFTKAELDAMRLESMRAGETDQERFEELLFLRGLIEPAMTEEQYRVLKGGNAAVYYALLNAVVQGNGLTELAKSDARRTFRA